MSPIWQIYTSEIKMKKIYIFKHYPPPLPFLWPWDVYLELSYLQPPLWKNPGPTRETINENGTIRKRSPEWNLSFENAVFACTCGQTKTELFQNAAGHTISSNPLCAILKTYSRWRTGASLSCLLYVGLDPILVILVATIVVVVYVALLFLLVKYNFRDML